MKIRNVNDNLGERSSDNPDRLRGAGLDLEVLDEKAYQDPMAWPTAGWSLIVLRNWKRLSKTLLRDY